MSSFTLLKQPHEQQRKFLDSTAREQLFGGAKRGGKSAALCMKAILLSFFYPGNKFLLCRKDFTDLWDSTLAEFFQICPPELYDTSYGNSGLHKGERTIRLKTIAPGITSDIVYRGLGDWSDLEKVKSLNAAQTGIDEASEIDYETYKMLRAQLTWVLPNGQRPPYMMLLTSNPEPGWVKERFLESRPEGCAFIPSLPRQNPFLPPGWEAELRTSYDAEWVEKYLDGSWEVSEGSVFPELDARIHAIDPIDTSELGLIGSIDHGSTGYTAFVLAGVDHDHNLFILHEHYEKDKLVSHHAERIKALIAQYCPEVEPPQKQKKLRFILIDPSCNARTQQGFNKLQSVADVYREYGINPVPAWNAMEAGFSRLKEMMHVKPQHLVPLMLDGSYPKVQYQVGSPSIFVVKKNCPETWKDMKEVRKEIMPSGQVRYVGRDHGLDNVRYIANALPRPEPLTTRDKTMIPLQDRFATSAHDRWASKFGKPSRHPLFGSTS